MDTGEISAVAERLERSLSISAKEESRNGLSNSAEEKSRNGLSNSAEEKSRNGLSNSAEEKSRNGLSNSAEEKSRRYQKEGKEAAQEGDLERSLELFRLAYEMQPSAKLKNRIQRLQEALEEEMDFVNVNNSGLMLFKELYDKLYDHQKEGVAFLYSLHRDGRRGGILADDMGLGKTIQVISFLSGMYDAELASHTLLVMPTSLIKNWVREFTKWTPGMRVKEFHGTSKAERNRNLERIQRKGGVVITTYQMLINNWEQLSTLQEKEFCWDYVILDEAHKIKTSSTKTAKCAHNIPARHRLLLTGTPVQNNLREMWALFDFACQGALLGTAKTFKTEYENPITRAREKDATPGEKVLGLKISQNLMELIKPYFLRRTKAEVQHKKSSANGAGEKEEEELEKTDSPAEMPSLTRKNDLIIWTYLSPVQEDIYRQFLSLDHIKELLTTTRSPLAELTVLKKLCDHPRLLSTRAVTQLGLEEGSATDRSPQEDESESAASRIDHVSDETLLVESGKLGFLVSLLERLREEDHRTLVFSQSRKMLDIIERILRNRNFQMLRVDGTVTHLVERERRITLFQTERRYSVFLLTTQVGGVGITLTAADRVVIFDPSWNPATDAQAVDRAYRIGQTEDVVIYRLITCGTVEEKIYRRQVFKDSLIRQTTGDKKNPFRYFSKQELKELFTLEDARSSSTQLQLQELHSQHRRSDPKLDSHIAELHRMEMFGISDHDLLFSKEAAPDEDDPQDAESDRYIQTRVQKAQELVQAESELHGQLMDSIANSTEPAWLRLAKQRGVDESSRKDPTDRERGKHSHPCSHPAAVAFTHSGLDNLNELSYGSEVEVISEDMNDEVISGGVVDLSDGALSAGGTVSMTTPARDVEGSAEEHAEGSAEEHAEGSAEEHAKEHTEGSAEEHAEEHHSVFSLSLQELSLQVEDKHQPLVKDDPGSARLFSPHIKKAVRPDSPEAPLEGVQETSVVSSSVLEESFQGRFNLQLEDSADMFSAQEEEAEEEDEEERDPAEEQWKFQLHMDASGDRLVSRETSSSDLPMMQQSTASSSADESFLNPVKKKKAHVLCDSDEEEEQEDSEKVEQVEKTSLASSPLASSFKNLGSSTPKSVLETGALSRRSLNTSVASRRSFVERQLEDEEDEDDLSEEVELSQASEANGTFDEESVEEEEEPSGETLNSENMGESGGASRNEYESGEEEEEECEEEQSALEESTGDVELGSSEALEQCAPKRASSETPSRSTTTNKPPVEESFEALVHSGKRSLAAGKKQEALDLFLKAIDINSGDGEVQLLIIQLYRQLSAQ